MHTCRNRHANRLSQLSLSKVHAHTESHTIPTYTHLESITSSHLNGLLLLHVIGLLHINHWLCSTNSSQNVRVVKAWQTQGESHSTRVDALHASKYRGARLGGFLSRMHQQLKGICELCTVVKWAIYLDLWRHNKRDIKLYERERERESKTECSRRGEERHIWNTKICTRDTH